MKEEKALSSNLDYEKFPSPSVPRRTIQKKLIGWEFRAINPNQK